MKKKDQSTLTQGVRGKTAASQQRRQDIVGAAKTVFFEQGYQLASMDRIAAAAHTTKRTLYDHFGDKDARSQRVSNKVAADLSNSFRDRKTSPLTRQSLSGHLSNAWLRYSTHPKRYASCVW